jgi:hypothetical protein
LGAAAVGESRQLCPRSGSMRKSGARVPKESGLGAEKENAAM